MRHPAFGNDVLARRIAAHVDALCTCLPDRLVGGAGNRAANEYFARRATDAGLALVRLPFDCVAWDGGRVTLTAGGEEYPAHGSPYSLPCDLTLPLVAASTPEELEAVDAAGRILLLHGVAVAEQLTPRRYPFYRLEAHTRILAALDRIAPSAVVAATGRNPAFAGSVHPFPFLVDADVDIPSAYIVDTDGARLVRHVGAVAHLAIDSRRVATRSEQVVARLPGRTPGRIVVSAHIDTAPQTPGALDNATGVACLLALADLFGPSGACGSLPAASGQGEDAGDRRMDARRPATAPVDPDAFSLGRTLELVPFNGEDNYAAPGEVAYIAANDDRFDDVAVAINVDAAGHREGATAVSFYGCPDAVRSAVRDVLVGCARIAEGPEWPQSDHMVFAMRGVPALAVTSESLERICAEVSHSRRDVPELVDSLLLADTVRFLADAVVAVDRALPLANSTG